MNYLFINDCINEALKSLKYKIPKNYIVEPTKKISFGDFASNVAMILANMLKINPEEIAKKIIKKILQNYKNYFQKIEFVKPGFINFFISQNIYAKVIHPFLKTKYNPKKLPNNLRKNINLEFVSANPTGALHLGHVRNAYVSQTLYNVLRSIGHKVTSEYWLNDMGTQIDLFELSVLCRYLELFKKKVNFPEVGYQGEDPYNVAKLLKKQYGDKYLHTKFDDKKIIDPKIKKEIWKFSINTMVNQIKEHLKMINVSISVWTSETKVYNSDIVDTLQKTTFKKYTYKKDGALWLKTTESGDDDKDRVLIKSDGNRTYFLTDIANQYNKKRRKFDLFLHVWGSDHEGHVKRMKSAMPVINAKPEDLEVVLIQMVKIVNKGEEVKLSKRAGNAITIPDMLKMMTVDTSRWYILAQANKTQIVIDIDRVTKMDNSNPVYYVQYAYARIYQLLNKVKLIDTKIPKSFTKLNTDLDRNLINLLMSLEPTIYSVGLIYEPHRLITYVHELAKVFHAWYNETNIKNLKDEELKKQKFYLAKAIATAIHFVLDLVGISSPKQMK